MLILAQHDSTSHMNIDQRVIYAETAGTEQGVIETNDGKAAQELAST